MLLNSHVSFTLAFRSMHDENVWWTRQGKQLNWYHSNISEFVPFQRNAHHLNLFLVDSLFSIIFEGFAIATLTFYFIAFHVIESPKPDWHGVRHIVGAISVASVFFLTNYFSFTSVWNEKKRIRQAELCESTFNNLQITIHERPVNNCIVKLLETFSVIQKLTWILMIVYIVFRNINESAYVILLKVFECYFLATFYVVGKLHQGNKKVKIGSG